MRTFPSKIFQLIGRIEVTGESRTCAICKNIIPAHGHAEGCPVVDALEEANKIAEEMIQPAPASPIVYPTGVRGIEFPGPATCRSTVANVPAPAEGHTI